MFTGLIQDVGTLEGIHRRGPEARFTIRTNLAMEEWKIGDSVAVNGTCLTVTTMEPGRFTTDLSDETLKRTSFDQARTGDRVNLELALRLSDRLGGHLVQGHVDQVGHVAAQRSVGDGWELSYDLPESLLDTVVEKGSITIDGVSLTIATLAGARITVAVIPHTAEQTNLLDRSVGDRVNIETDLVAKYVRRTLDRLSEGEGGLTLETLKKAGFA